MGESTWVRSVYLYAICGVALLTGAVGAVTTVVAVSNIISPSLGHRDSLDRVGIGLANVAEEVITVLDGNAQEENEQFCEDVTDNDDEFEECLDDFGSSGNGIDEVTDGIGSLRGELEGQIRDSAVASLIRGLLYVIVAWLLWRFHSRRTDLYRDGGLRGKRPADPPLDAGLATADSTVPTIMPPVVPPPPAMQPMPELAHGGPDHD
jgi:hypothetical protein